MAQESTTNIDEKRGKFLNKLLEPKQLEKAGTEKSTRIVYRVYIEDDEGNGEVAILPAEVSCISTTIVPDFENVISITEAFRKTDNDLADAKQYNPKAQDIDGIQRSIYNLQTDESLTTDQKLNKLEGILSDTVRAYGVDQYFQVLPGHYSKSVNSKYDVTRILGIENNEEEQGEGGENKNKRLQKVFSFSADLIRGDMVVQDGDYMEDDWAAVFDVNNGITICEDEIIIGTKVAKQSCAMAFALYASLKNGNIEPAKVRAIAKNLLTYRYFTSMWQRDGSINTTELNSKIKTLKSLSMNLQRSKNGETPPEPSENTSN